MVLRDGRDPADARRAARLKDRAELIEAQRRLAEEAQRAEAERRADRTVRELFAAWLAGSGDKAPRRKDGNAELRRSFGVDILPTLGDRPLRAITVDDIRGTLRGIGVERGRGRLAVLALRDLSQMLSWASEEREWRDLLPEGNVARKVKPADIVLPEYDIANMSQRTLSDDEIRDLHRRLAALDRAWLAAPDRRARRQPVRQETQLALWIVLSTTCRIGELLQAEWAHVDLEKREWIIPRANFKRERGDSRTDYAVFLSPFAARQFEALKGLTGDGRWLFPSGRTGKAGPPGATHVDLKSVARQIADRQVSVKVRRTKHPAGRVADDSLLLSGGEWSTHDLRRTGSTLMQRLKIDNDTRNRCLNHVVGSRIDRTYGTFDFRDEKTEAWVRLGAELDRILAPDVATESDLQEAA